MNNRKSRMSFFYVVTITSFKDPNEPLQYLFKDELKAIQHAYTKLLSNSYFEHPNRWCNKISDEEIKTIYEKYMPHDIDELYSSIDHINELGFKWICPSFDDMCEDGQWTCNVVMLRRVDE